MLIRERNSRRGRTLFVAGAGRHSVAAVAHAIDSNNRYRDMFEPFNKHHVNDCRLFNHWLYLSPSDNNERYVKPLNKILSGKLRNPVVDRWNNNRIFDRRLIRESRANLWLKWMKHHASEVSIILVLRHPCTIASGSLVLERMDRLSSLVVQPALMRDHLAPFQDVLSKAQDKFDKYILFWCIQHYVPLRQFAPDQVYVVCYETLCAEPEVELPKLLDHVRKAFDGELTGQMSVPAARDFERLASLLDPWRRQLSSQQVKRAVEILRIFGLDEIYTDDTMPNPQGVSRFMQRAATTS